MSKSSFGLPKLLTTGVLTLFILTAFVISGFTVTQIDDQPYQKLPPSEGPAGNVGDLPVTGAGEDDDSANGGVAEPVDVIRNGGFEELGEEDLAAEWERFTNGQAFFGFYDDQWPEAVRTGEHAILMEINLVEPNILDRIIAIYQTVDVAPNSTYDLTINAIMRSQAPAIDRNKFEFEMHWGVDFSGEGNFDNVVEWNLMPLTEQFRLGSTGEFPEDIHLFYEVVTGTIETGDSNTITLFIRGLKKFPTGTEIDFNVDDVSLVGPPPGGPVVIVTPEASAPEEEDNSLPTSGAVLPNNVPMGALILGSIVLIVLGTSAAAGLLQNRKEI